MDFPAVQKSQVVDPGADFGSGREYVVDAKNSAHAYRSTSSKNI